MALKRTTGLKRKSPMKRKPPESTPAPRTPMRKKKPSVAAAQCLQRRALAIRSGSACEMEVRDVSRGTWIRCNKRACDPAHVFTRPKCGAARDHADAVIYACRPCHERSGGKLGTDTTRVPLRRAQAAWRVILRHSRLGTDEADRLRIHIGSVGPYPQMGSAPYA